MNAIVRLGAVNYLNVRPLVHGLDRHPRVRLRFDLPSTCAELLSAGDIDLGMIPSIAYLDRPTDAVVPGICIGSDGPVASVALFARRPVRDIASIALDTSSRTSATLTRILCARRFGIAPAFIPHGPDLPSMLQVADAALLIGDPALFADHRALGAEKIDLGAEWTAMTSLPFVWAFWAGPAAGLEAGAIRTLQDAASLGRASIDAIASEYCAGDPRRIALARDYLRQNLRFDFTTRAIDGLDRFYAEAASLGLVPSPGRVRFFASEI